MPLTRQQVFTRRRQSVRAARDFAVRTLTGWGRAERLEEIRLCVSEAATNALVHGVPPERRFAVRVEAEDDGSVRVEVRDTGRGSPVEQTPGPEDESGRGLLLVSELADEWGVIEHSVGKTVWLAFKAAPTRRG